MNNADRWKNRRKMAWLSVVAGLAFPLLVLWTDSDQLGQIAIPFYVFITGIVSSYFGWSTWEDVSHDKNSSTSKLP